MYAVVKTGGKQHRLRSGDLIRVEKIEGDLGAEVTFDDVLMVGETDGAPTFGRPFIEGAKVKAQIVRQAKGKKVIVFKMKPNKQYHRKYGHRQPFTQLRVTGIEV